MINVPERSASGDKKEKNDDNEERRL